MKENELQQSGLTFTTPLKAMLGRTYRKYAAAVLLIDGIGACAVVASPLAQRILIDGVNALNRSRTFYGVLAVALLLGISLLCQTGSYLLRFRLGVDIRCRIKSAVFHCLLGLPETFLKNRGSSYFFNRIQADSAEVVGFFSGNALTQFSDLLKFLFALAVIFCLRWKCALLLLPCLCLQYWLYHNYRTKQYKLGHKIQECTASERTRMQEYLTGHTTLKTHNAAQQAAEKIDQGFLRWRILAFQRLFHENRFRVFLTLPLYLCIGGIMIYGLNQILLRQYTLGELWALLALVRQVFGPVQSLAVARFKMQSVQAAWDRLRQITQAAAFDTETDHAPCSLKGDIEFSGIGFSYTEERSIFKNLNFTVKANELFFLTGENGSGKTTLFQLFLRLYEPGSGEIRIGGKSIREYPLAAYRVRIGYLGQSPEFFPGTIRENLLLNLKHSDRAIMNVMALLKSEDLILKRPGGLDSPVMERGENFSGGERLRLALARELLRDTDILLLDEPAASLDPDARKYFYDLLTQLRGKCTILAIVHDTLPPSDQYTTFQLQKIQP